MDLFLVLYVTGILVNIFLIAFNLLLKSFAYERIFFENIKKINLHVNILTIEISNEPISISSYISQVFLDCLLSWIAVVVNGWNILKSIHNSIFRTKYSPIKEVEDIHYKLQNFSQDAKTTLMLFVIKATILKGMKVNEHNFIENLNVFLKEKPDLAELDFEIIEVIELFKKSSFINNNAAA